jgi:riboflavin kinase/FMN adenylyltransferase
MELIRGHHNLRPRHRGCVATIGNFDGVHLGHQMVLGQVAIKAAEMGLPSQVITFEPLPLEYFGGKNAPARLTRFREKVQALQRFSVDRLLCLRFNRALASLPAERFITQILVQGLGIRYLVVGDDFRFGRERRGDFAMLKETGRAHGYAVVNIPTFEIDGQRVSSTRVRQTLEAGRMVDAEKLLGRPYRMSGRVAHGERRGRILGFPTANIRLEHEVCPVQGVFAVEVYGLETEPLQGVANVGYRPTVNGVENRLEAHLFDFDEDIYGRHVHVDFVHKIRDEVRFESLDQLKRQIASDVGSALRYFRTRHTSTQDPPHNT